MNDYDRIPPELRLILYGLERAFYVDVGNGEVFKKNSKREISDVRHSFIYIANMHFDASQELVCKWIQAKQGIVFNAKRRVVENITNNIPYRNKLYNVAMDNGITTLVLEISKIADERERKV